MALIFASDDAQHDIQTDTLFAEKAVIGRTATGVLLALVALLIAGTLKVSLLSDVWLAFTLPLSFAEAWQAQLFAWIPFDAAKGEEGVSLQGSVLIGLLVAIGITAWKGMENIIEGPNSWTWVTLVLTALTLLFATLKLTPQANGLNVAFTGRVVAEALSLAAAVVFARKLTAEDWQAWMWESWRFVKQIFLLLIAGVFVVGMVRAIIQPEWIQALAGENNLQGNATAVFFGVFMYFPTLVEVPVAKMFLDLGMHPGPLLAYLMADPELSLQSILMISAVIGRRKAFTYVFWVAIFSVIAGLLFGSWVDAFAIAI
jgi:uncharacterized protein